MPSFSRSTGHEDEGSGGRQRSADNLRLSIDLQFQRGCDAVECNAASLVCFAQQELPGGGATFEVRLHQQRRVGQSSEFLDFDLNLAAPPESVIAWV